MASRRNIAYIIGIVALIVAPTVLTLSYYQVTKNPQLRPFSVTEQNLREYMTGRGQGVRIIARVDWVDGHSGGYSQKEFKRAVTQAFRAKGVDVEMMFYAGQDRTTVTYKVGKSWMGPYSTVRAAEGISAAVDAYHMYVPVE